MIMTNRICVAQFTGAHGVHGRLRLKSFTQVPEAVFDYQPLTDEQGTREYRVTLTGMGKDHFMVKVEGVKDRTQADALKGTRLYVERDRLPAPDDEDEFYHADLIGLPAVTTAGEPFGTVKALYDFGAGDMVEILHTSDKTVFIPFTKACVPVVDVKTGHIVVDPPENLFAPAGPQVAEGEPVPEGLEPDGAADRESESEAAAEPRP